MGSLVEFIWPAEGLGSNVWHIHFKRSSVRDAGKEIQVAQTLRCQKRHFFA